MSSQPPSVNRRLLPSWICAPAALYLGVGLLALAASAVTSLALPHYVPSGADEFANLMDGQTFARGALTNPPHPLWEFFESQHVLMQPTYMAKYPPAEGLFLAVGIRLGDPLFGIWLASAFFAAATAWMVRGFFSTRWALLAGVIVIGQFGLGCYWTQSYWGGPPAALGGALVFGGTRRLLRGGGMRDSLLLGAGIVLLMLSRPFEGLLLCVVPAALLFHALWTRRLRWPTAFGCAAVILAGGLFQLAFNYRVTGNPWRMPYMAYEAQYSAAPLFVWQKVGPEPHFTNPPMALLYREYILPNSQHYGTWLEAWWRRAKLNFVFQLGGLLGAVAIGGLVIRPARWALLAWLIAGIASAAWILAFWTQLHYEAPVAAVLIFAAVHGVRAFVLQFPWRRRAAWLVLSFAAIYALSLRWAVDKRLPINPSGPARQRIIDSLAAVGGRFVVIVRSENPAQRHFDWIYNDALIDQSRVVWARDRGEPENQKLVRYFHDRNFLLLVDGVHGIAFSPYLAAVTRATPAP